MSGATFFLSSSSSTRLISFPNLFSSHLLSQLLTSSSYLFCLLSSSLPLSSYVLWSLNPARLPREPGEGCEGHCPHPCPMPGLAGALCLLRGFMNPCVCGNGAGSLRLSGGRGAPWGREPASLRWTWSTLGPGPRLCLPPPLALRLGQRRVAGERAAG